MKERLVSKSKGSLQGTDSYNLIASLHRSQRDRKLKEAKSIGPIERLTGGTINTVNASLQEKRGD